MRRSLFVVFMLLVLLCGCEKTLPIAETGTMSVDAAFYGTLDVREIGRDVAVVKNGEVVAVIEDVNCLSAFYSTDRTAVAFTIAEHDAPSRELLGITENRVYYYKDELIHIADNATVYSAYVVSEDEPTLFYSLNTDYSAYLASQDINDIFNVTADIYVWRNDESTLLHSGKNAGIIASPDCKTIYFRMSYGIDDTEYYYYDNGNLIHIDANLDILNISDGNEFVYYTEDDCFYVQNGLDRENRRKLCNTEYMESLSIIYNAKKTQVMWNDGGALYISVMGGEPKLLCAAMEKILVPELTFSDYTDPVLDDFAGQFILTEDGCIYRITEDYEAVYVSGEVSDAYIADDRETIIFTTGYIINTSIVTVNGNNPTERKIFSPGSADYTEYNHSRYIEWFSPSYDGKTIYYTDLGGGLYAVGGGYKKFIDKDPEFASWYANIQIYDNDKLYYAKDKTLYRYDGEKTEVMQRYLVDVKSIYSIRGALEVSVEIGDRVRVYHSYDGVSFVTDKTYRDGITWAEPPKAEPAEKREYAPAPELVMYSGIDKMYNTDGTQALFNADGKTVTYATDDEEYFMIENGEGAVEIDEETYFLL